MISIIIPTYNHAPELDQCLASIRRQTRQDFEIIVVDDGSNDDPESIVKKYSNLKFIKQENKGANIARNRGFEIARGEYVIFVDADIIMRNDMLDLMQKKLQENPEASFVYSAFKIGKKKMKFIPYDKNKLKSFNFIHTTSLIRTRDFPGFDEKIKKFQDWDLWLTMLNKKDIGIGISKVLFQIINPGQGTMSNWLPKFIYKIPWPVMGFTPKTVISYFKAQKIIKQKHNLA